MRAALSSNQTPSDADRLPLPGDTHVKAKSLTQDGIEQSARGKRDIVKGRVQDALGGLTGDAGLQLKGKLNQAKGNVQDAIGKAERKIERAVDREP